MPKERIAVNRPGKSYGEYVFEVRWGDEQDDPTIQVIEGVYGTNPRDTTPPLPLAVEDVRRLSQVLTRAINQPRYSPFKEAPELPPVTLKQLDEALKIVAPYSQEPDKIRANSLQSLRLTPHDVTVTYKDGSRLVTETILQYPHGKMAVKDGEYCTNENVCSECRKKWLDLERAYARQDEDYEVGDFRDPISLRSGSHRHKITFPDKHWKVAKNLADKLVPDTNTIISLDVLPAMSSANRQEAVSAYRVETSTELSIRDDEKGWSPLTQVRVGPIIR